MEIHDYIEHQKLIGNGKKPTKIFLDKLVRESNSLDNNQNINLIKFYSHFSSKYDLDWIDKITNDQSNTIESKDLKNNNLDDVNDVD